MPTDLASYGITPEMAGAFRSRPLALGASGQTPIDTRIADALLKESMSGGVQDFRTGEQSAAKIVQALVGSGLAGAERSRQEGIGQELEATIAGLEDVKPETRSVLGILAREPKNRPAVAEMITKIQERNETRAMEARKIDAADRRAREEREFKLSLEERKAGLKAPEQKERKEGGEIVTERFNPATGQFEEVSRAPRSESELDRLFEISGIAKGTQAAKDLARGILEAKGKGQFFEVTQPDGTTIRFGTKAGPDDLSSDKVTRRLIDKDLMAATEGQRRLNEIARAFRPEFQTAPGQLQGALLGLQDWLGIDIGPEGRAQLSDFSVFRRRAYEALNKYIKDITGAQMSEAEAKRLGKAFANPEKDSPTQFAAKLNDLIFQNRMSVARLHYMRKNGIEISTNPGANSRVLDKQPSIEGGQNSEMFRVISRRREEIAKEMRGLRTQKPGQTKAQFEREILGLASRKAASEFGLIGVD